MCAGARTWKSPQCETDAGLAPIEDFSKYELTYWHSLCYFIYWHFIFILMSLHLLALFMSLWQRSLSFGSMTTLYVTSAEELIQWSLPRGA